MYKNISTMMILNKNGFSIYDFTQASENIVFN